MIVKILKNFNLPMEYKIEELKNEKKKQENIISEKFPSNINSVKIFKFPLANRKTQFKRNNDKIKYFRWK